MSKIIGFEELREILTTQCYFAKDVILFSKKYADSISALSFEKQREIEDIMELEIECDNYCI